MPSDSTVPLGPTEYDWEALRAKIIANGGIRNATMVARMPDRAPMRVIMTGVSEGIHPVFDPALYANKAPQNKKRD